uniref:Uncharacterized protein n=1 Tax=Arundo donax TaxID=35708 RepID=A0A0A9GYC8_ARUDO
MHLKFNEKSNKTTGELASPYSHHPTPIQHQLEIHLLLTGLQPT